MTQMKIRSKSRWILPAAVAGLLLLTAILVREFPGALPPTRLPVHFPISQTKKPGSSGNFGTLSGEASATIAGPATLERPAPRVAGRNERRSRYSWILPNMGLSPQTIAQLANGDTTEAIRTLKQQAAMGDAAARRSLGFLYLNACLGGRTIETLDDYEATQQRQASVLSATDAAWYAEFLRQSDLQDRAAVTWCATLDRDQVSNWIDELAAQGDGASLWLQSQTADRFAEEQAKLRAAAAAGFAPAEYELAIWLGDGSPGWAGDGYSADSVRELLRNAATEMPRARSSLAICEYSGCGGSTPDPVAAVIDARRAAQLGSPDALIALDTRLPPGQLDLDEAAAWKVVQALMQQSGCDVGSISVNWMRTTSLAVSPSGATLSVLRLAQRYWNQYSGQMMTAQGCNP
jgi:TPR repeat protein